MLEIHPPGTLNVLIYQLSHISVKTKVVDWLCRPHDHASTVVYTLAADSDFSLVHATLTAPPTCHADLLL